MTNAIKTLTIQLTPPEDGHLTTHEALLGPTCLLCGGISRLTGIEPHPRDDHTDLRSYECIKCGHPFTADVPLHAGRNGANENKPQD